MGSEGFGYSQVRFSLAPSLAFFALSVASHGSFSRTLFFIKMASSENPVAVMEQATKKKRKCGHCKGEGHDKRNCPGLNSGTTENSAVQATVNRNTVVATQPRAPSAVFTPHVPPVIDWKGVIYDIFDLETTGFSKQ